VRTTSPPDGSAIIRASDTVVVPEVVEEDPPHLLAVQDNHV